MKKTVIKIIAFICIFAILFLGVDNILKFKYSDGIRQINQFYKEEDDSIDVLIIGSSHAFLNIYPEVLWRDYGYSSFVLAASLQPTWSSYHYLVEALKTQTPKVIIFEGYRLTEQKDFVEKGTTIKNLYGLKWSKNKIEAIKASIGTNDESSTDTRSPEEIAQMEQLPLELANYHSRYAELSSQDFLKHYGLYECKYYKGNIVGTKVYSKFKQPNVDAYNKEIGELTEKTEEYYRKILELGKEYDIPVVTAIAPFYMTNKEYAIYLAAEQIAHEYDQLFINYNEYYEELGLNFSTDILDAGSHLNVYGGEKFTSALGQFINDNFDIPDRRGDERYESWEIATKEYTRAYATKGGLTEINEPTAYAQHMLDNDDYSFTVVINGAQNSENISSTFDEETKKLFETLDVDISELTDGVWYFKNGELIYSNTTLESFKKSYQLDEYSDIQFAYGPILNNSSKDKKPISAFFINKDSNDQIYYENSLIIYTYDNFVHEHVDTFVYTFDGNRK